MKLDGSIFPGGCCSKKNVKSLHTPKWLNCDILYYNSLKLQLHKIKPKNTAQNNKISKLFMIKTMLHWERKPDREMRKKGSLELFLSTARHKGTKVNLVLTRSFVTTLDISLYLLACRKANFLCILVFFRGLPLTRDSRFALASFSPLFS